MKDIRRQTRRHFSAEDKIRMVLEGLRGEGSLPRSPPYLRSATSSKAMLSRRWSSSLVAACGAPDRYRQSCRTVPPNRDGSPPKSRKFTIPTRTTSYNSTGRLPSPVISRPRVETLHYFVRRRSNLNHAFVNADRQQVRRFRCAPVKQLARQFLVVAQRQW